MAKKHVTQLLMRWLLSLFIFIYTASGLLAQESEDVAFAVIEQVPVFPGCEELTSLEQRKCLQDGLAELVSKNYNLKMVQKLDLEPGKIRVYVHFRINHHGDVDEIKARAPHRKLEQEAIRVLKLAPQMIPGKNRGKTVGVKYTLPITMLVERKKSKK